MGDTPAAEKQSATTTTTHKCILRNAFQGSVRMIVTDSVRGWSRRMVSIIPAMRYDQDGSGWLQRERSSATPAIIRAIHPRSVKMTEQELEACQGQTQQEWEAMP